MANSYYYYHYSRRNSHAGGQSIAYVAVYGLICLISLAVGAVSGLIRLLYRKLE